MNVHAGFFLFLFFGFGFGLLLSLLFNFLLFQSVFLHYLGDMLSSFFVLVAGLLLHYFHGDWTEYLDPVFRFFFFFFFFFLDSENVTRD